MAIEYQDFEVEVSHCLCGKPEVRVLESPFNRPRARFEPPYEPEALNAKLDELDELLMKSGKEDIQEQRRIAEEIGQKLFRALFPGKIGRTLGQSLASLDATRDHRDAGLRLRISFGESGEYRPEIVGLPWELLCDPETMTFPGSDPSTPVVRYLDLAKRIKPLATPPPIKVLAVLSSPKEDGYLTAIDLRKQEQILRHAASQQKWLKTHFLKTPTLAELRSKLDKHKQAGRPFHVLHFLGHGDFESAGEGVLFFGKAGGGGHAVSGRELARQLSGFDELRLAVLAACVGAQMLRQQGQNPFTGVASALIARGFPAVVAMQFTVSEAAASRFIHAFYEKVAAGRPVDEAVTEGRLQIAADDTESFEWATPVLFLRTPDGHILDLQPEAETPVKRIAIFNIKDHGKAEVDVNDLEVDLTPFFDGLTIENEKDWNVGVLDTIRSEFKLRLREDVPYHLALAAPISVAFTAGYLIGANMGIEIAKLSQRGPSGTSHWTFHEDVPEGAPQWLGFEKASAEMPEGIPIDQESPDVAVAVGLSRSVLPGLAGYLAHAGTRAPSFGRIFNAVLDVHPGHDTVVNGAHAVRLANALCEEIHRHISSRLEGTVHLFISGPNAFAFALGRLSRVFPAIQLYEYNFGGRGAGANTYAPSITLSPRLVAVESAT